MEDEIIRCTDGNNFPSPSEDSTAECYCGNEYLQTSKYCMHQWWIIGFSLGGALVLLVILSSVIAWLAVSRASLKKKDEEKEEEKTDSNSDDWTGESAEPAPGSQVSSQGNTSNPRENPDQVSVIEDENMRGESINEMDGPDYEPLPEEQETITMETETTNDPAHRQTTPPPPVANGHVPYNQDQAIPVSETDMYDEVGLPLPHADGKRDSGLSLSAEDPQVREILKSDAGRNFIASLENVATDVDFSIQRPTITKDAEKKVEEASRILRQKRTQGKPTGYRESGSYANQVVYSNIGGEAQVST